MVKNCSSSIMMSLAGLLLSLEDKQSSVNSWSPTTWKYELLLFMILADFSKMLSPVSDRTEK